MSPELLTDLEHEAVEMAGRLWNTLCKIVDQDRTRDGDLKELVLHIHAIQNAVLSQAAARAYPQRYRLLGRELDGPFTVSRSDES